MGDIVDLVPAKNPDTILEAAKGVYKDCLILGWDTEGYLNVRATTGLTVAEITFIIEKFKHKLLSGDYAIE